MLVEKNLQVRSMDWIHENRELVATNEEIGDAWEKFCTDGAFAEEYSGRKALASGPPELWWTCHKENIKANHLLIARQFREVTRVFNLRPFNHF